MNGTKSMIIGAALTLVVGAAAAADETILFNTMGPGGNWYDPNNATSINSGDFHIESGFRFTNSTGDNLFLTRLVHGIRWTSGVNEVTLTVHTSSFGLPGTALESVTVSNLPNAAFGLQSPHSVNFSGSTLLEAGQEYVITAAASSLGGSLGWGHNTQGVTGGVVLKFGEGGSWFDPGATNITPAATVFGVIPAPGAMALLGIAGLASRRRRRD